MLLWLAVAVGALAIGSTGWGFVSLETRVQAVLLASVVGGALGAAGCIYQAVLRNPLADPYLLGVSSGAALASYLYFSPVWLTGAAAAVAVAVGPSVLSLAGAGVAVVLAVGISMRNGRPEPLALVLTGVVITAMFSAIFVLLTTLRPELTAASGGPMRFLIGALQSPLSAWQWATTLVLVAAGWLVCLRMLPALNVAQLADTEARAMGVSLGRLRLVAVGGASVMVAAAVSVSGPIGFVGIVCPHVARMLVGTDQRRLYPAATAGGAILLVAADALCRGLSQPEMLNKMLPVGVITAMLGAPFFLLLLRKSRRNEEV
jgi:iron complex transport system permease protein